MKKLYLIAILFLALPSCANFTSNIRRIQPGMSADEMTGILGDPSRKVSKGNTTQYYFESGQMVCSIAVADDKVTANPRCVKNHLSENISDAAMMKMLMK